MPSTTIHHTTYVNGAQALPPGPYYYVGTEIEIDPNKPMVGLNRKVPIHPQYLKQSWVPRYIAGGCNHRDLGISVEGVEHFLRVVLELFKDEERGIVTGNIRRPEDSWITEMVGSVPDEYDRGTSQRRRYNDVYLQVYTRQ